MDTFPFPKIIDSKIPCSINEWSNSKTPLEVSFHVFLEWHLHDSKTFCMKILQNLVHPVISGDYPRAHLEIRPPMPFGPSNSVILQAWDPTQWIYQEKFLEPHLRKFPASQSNLFNCPNHRKDSSKIARCYAIPLLPPDCTLSQPLNKGQLARRPVAQFHVAIL